VGVARFYDNVYRYAISGDRLRFTVVKNARRDRLAEGIRTHPARSRAAPDAG
jgi:hypothetical protein